MSVNAISINVKEKMEAENKSAGDVIQEALNKIYEESDIDSNGEPIYRYQDGVTLFFPCGRYDIDRPIILPRVNIFRHVIFKGEGWGVSAILSAKGYDPSTEDPDNPDPNAFKELIKGDDDESNIFDATGYVFEDLVLGVRENQQVFNWNILVPRNGEEEQQLERDQEKEPDETPEFVGRRLRAHFHRVLFRGGEASGPALVFIRGGYRIRFDDCLFHGAYGEGNVSMKFLNTGGLGITDSSVYGNKGALIDMEGGGECVIVNSRSEGGVRVPAWKFKNASNITLIGPANEGVNERPSIFQFQSCKNVIVINPQIAKPDVLENNTIGDGMRFENCINCHVIGGISNSFIGVADGTARMIRVDESSKYITGKGIINSNLDPLRDLSILGEDCHFELIGGNEDKGYQVKSLSTFPDPEECIENRKTLWLNPMDFKNFHMGQGPAYPIISFDESSGKVTVYKSGGPYARNTYWIGLTLNLPNQSIINSLLLSFQTFDGSAVNKIKIIEQFTSDESNLIFENNDRQIYESVNPTTIELGINSRPIMGALTLIFGLSRLSRTGINFGKIGVVYT